MINPFWITLLEELKDTGFQEVIVTFDPGQVTLSVDMHTGNPIPWAERIVRNARIMQITEPGRPYLEEFVTGHAKRLPVEITRGGLERPGKVSVAPEQVNFIIGVGKA